MAAEAFALFELQQHVRRVLALNFEDPIWVRAEIAQVNKTGGHCYLTLVEKEPDQQGIRARAEAAVWSKNLRKIRDKVNTHVEHLLAKGSYVSLLVEVTFHEAYGLRLSIVDIDETYTLGQLELQRQRTIKRLQAEKLMDLNKNLAIPQVLQRIALISSESAAGYLDFIQHLQENQYSYAYHVKLFQNAVQGERVLTDLQANLHEIDRRQRAFDVVIILRGGGSKLDLKAFDDYHLCVAVAKCNLPVISAIGHQSDQTVVDLCSALALKTPTAAAEFCIERNHMFETDLLHSFDRLRQALQHRIHHESLRLQQLRHVVSVSGQRSLLRAQQDIQQLHQRIKQGANHLVSLEMSHCKSLSEKVSLLDPLRVLQRGYSLTTKSDGSVVHSAQDVVEGDPIKTRLANGTFESTVTSIDV